MRKQLLIQTVLISFFSVSISFASDITHTTAVLSQARSSLAGATAGGKALFAGGYNHTFSQRYSIVDIYDPSAEEGMKWTTSSLSLSQETY